MPRWFKSLCRQARLHAHREARTRRPQNHTPHRLENLEPRMLLSGTLSDGLQSHWQLDDDPGVIAVDIVGTNDFDVQNGATLDPAAGRLDGALSFDGIDDKAEAGDVLDPLSGDYSVGFWFKRSDTDAFSGYQTLISKGNRYSTREGFSINLAGNTDEINIRVNSSDSTAERASTEITMPQDDEWHHLLMVVDRTDGRVRGYLDGSNSGWRSGGGGPSSSNISGLTEIDTDDPLTLGAVRDGSGTYNRFEGSLDDVRIYDRALTAGEAFSLANPPELENGLLAHYRADEASGTTTADELGTNDLTLINGTTFDTSGGRLDGALSFDGVDDKAEAGDVFDPGTGDYTASLWFKRPQGGALQSDQVLISKGNRYSTREGWSVNFSDATNEIRFRVNSSDDSSERASIEVNVPEDDEWHHLVVTIDHATNKLVGYLDGDNSVWRSGGGGPSSSSLSSITDIDTDDPFTIGAVRDGANTYYEFEGLVDEVRLYDRVLTEVEIAALGDPVAAPEASVQIAGDTEVEAHTGYVLGLNVENPDPDNPIDEWVIDWGDGTTPEVVIGSPTSVTHFYETPRESNYLVTATANAIADDGTVTSYTAEAAVALLVTPSTVVDTDDDGLVDFGEQTAGTDPENPDTDGDQFEDGFEVENYFPEIGLFNPLQFDDPNADHDNDRLSNIDEVLIYGTNPSSNLDTDGDSLSDDWEVAYGLNPLVGDGSYEYDVALGEYVKNYQDTDGDGINTLDEYIYGLDPNAFNPDLFTPAVQQSSFLASSLSASSSSFGLTALVNLWATIGDWSPSEDELWEMTITSDSTGKKETISAPNKTDTIPELIRLAPGDYTVKVNFKGPGSADGEYGYDYRALIRDNSGTPWGSGNSWLSGKGYSISSNGGLLADRVNGDGSNNASGKSAKLTVDTIQLDELVVSDSRYDLRQGSDSADGSSTSVVIPLDKDGNATINVEGMIDLSDFPSGTQAQPSLIKYELRDSDGTVVDSGDLGVGTAEVILPQNIVADYQLVAWVDGDGTGEIDNGEQELSVEVSVAQIDLLTVYSEEHFSNQVEKPIVGPGEILYVELEDQAQDVAIGFNPTLIGSGVEVEDVYYTVTGPGVSEADNFNDSDSPVVNLTQPGGSYIVSVGFDLDGNGVLDLDEVSIESESIVVQIDSLDVTETSYSINSVSNSGLGDLAPELFVAAQENGSASITLDALGSPIDSEAGIHVLWEVVDINNNSVADGNFGGADPSISLSLSEDLWTYGAFIGFDDNGDGILDLVNESDHATLIYIFSVSLVVGDGSSAGRRISYTPDDALDDKQDYTGNEWVDVTIQVDQNNIDFTDIKDRFVSGPSIESIREFSGGDPYSGDPLPPIPTTDPGQIIAVDAEQGEWRYKAPTELVSNIHPERVAALLEITPSGSNRVSENYVDVFSLFQYFNTSSLGNSRNTAMNYVNDKYDLVDETLFKSNEFTYDSNLEALGEVGWFITSGIDNRWARFGPGAFSNENLLASVIGHENVHYNQPVATLTSDDERVKERPAYEWEEANRLLTGISDSDYVDVQLGLNYINGTGPRPDNF